MDGSSQCLPSTATGGWRQPVFNIHCQAVNSFFIYLQINFGLSTFKKICSWTMLQGDIEKSQKYSKDGFWLPPYFVSVNLGEQALNTRGTKVSCRSQLYWEHQAICIRELRRVTWVKRTITTANCMWQKTSFSIDAHDEKQLCRPSYLLYLGGAWEHIVRTLLCFWKTEVTGLLSCFLDFSHKFPEIVHCFILGSCSNRIHIQGC